MKIIALVLVVRKCIQSAKFKQIQYCFYFDNSRWSSKDTLHEYFKQGDIFNACGWLAGYFQRCNLKMILVFAFSGRLCNFDETRRAFRDKNYYHLALLHSYLQLCRKNCIG